MKNDCFVPPFLRISVNISTFLFCVFALMLPISSAFAQQDLAPPELLSFSLNPTVFDAGLGPVTIDYCVTARDDLSGPRDAYIDGLKLPGPGHIETGVSFPGESLEETVCGQFTVPQYAPYGTYLLNVRLGDKLNNLSSFHHPDRTGYSYPHNYPALCQVGPCLVINTGSGQLPDIDGDGVPDNFDNCPTESNPNQEDRDHDLLGDACDPFPDNFDNEQAQCEADLILCQVDLVECRSNPSVPDQDGDDEPDLSDTCPNTPVAVQIDQTGCSLEQFCTAIDATSRLGKQICVKSDWRNDEPLMKPREADCAVNRGSRGPDDDRCVPKEN